MIVGSKCRHLKEDSACFKMMFPEGMMDDLVENNAFEVIPATEPFLERSFVSGEECEVIWTIKSLRNKWIEHDPDHGTPSKITKSWRTLDQALKSLGFSRTPVTPEEHMELQTRLLEKVEQFLRLLVERIGAAPRPASQE